jgi:uracil phosphoribosyltransferase
MTQPRVTVVDHPLVQHKLSVLRNVETSTRTFRQVLREIGGLLCYEATRDLPLETVEISTPLQRMTAPAIAGKKLVFAAILRSGMGLVEGMLDLAPSARVAHIGLYRDPRTMTAVEYYFKAPDDIGERLVIAVGPTLATGHTAVAAVERLKEAGATQIRFVALISTRQGLDAFHGAHPEAPVWTAAIDDGLDERGFIVPGLGDAGDRMYGTR